MWGLGPSRGPHDVNHTREAPRLRRGAANVWGGGGHVGAPMSAVAAGRNVAAVERLPEVLLGRILPELRHGRDGEDDRVLQLAVLVALHAADVDVLDRVAVRVELHGAPRRVGDLHFSQ